MLMMTGMNVTVLWKCLITENLEKMQVLLLKVF